MGGEQERVRVGAGAARCPFCHDGLDKVDELVACAPCGARFHAACHRDNHERCPACGASEVLVPPRPRARRREPPAGSRLRVEREAERTTIGWDPRTSGDRWLIGMFAVFVFLLPLAYLLWAARRRTPRAQVRLEPDLITFDAATSSGFGTTRIQVGPEQVGVVKVEGAPGGHGHALTIDVGLTRHRVLTGFTGMALSPPEMEWLAEEIRAWKAEQEG